MTGRHFLPPSPPARALLSAHAVLILRLYGPDQRRGLASIRRAQGCPRPPATSTRTGSHRSRRSTGPQDLLEETPKRPHETSLRSLPAAVAASGDSADAPGGTGAPGHTQAARSPGLRHGEDRLEGASQRPYPLSSSAAGCTALRRFPVSRATERTSLPRYGACTCRPVEGFPPPTNP
jgi:hypothetical protein